MLSRYSRTIKSSQGSDDHITTIGFLFDATEFQWICFEFYHSAIFIYLFVMNSSLIEVTVITVVPQIFKFSCWHVIQYHLPNSSLSWVWSYDFLLSMQCEWKWQATFRCNIWLLYKKQWWLWKHTWTWSLPWSVSLGSCWIGSSPDGLWTYGMVKK